MHASMHDIIVAQRATFHFHMAKARQSKHDSWRTWPWNERNAFGARGGEDACTAPQMHRCLTQSKRLSPKVQKQIRKRKETKHKTLRKHKKKTHVRSYMCFLPICPSFQGTNKQCICRSRVYLQKQGGWPENAELSAR